MKRQKTRSMFLIIICSILFASLLCGVQQVVQAQEFEHIIDFEDLPVDTVVYNQYYPLGVIFSSLPRIFRPSVNTISGVNALTTRNPGQEFDPGPLIVQFTQPQSRVGVYVGVDHNTNGYSIPVFMRAYDMNNIKVDEVGPVNLPPGPTPIQQLISVSTGSSQVVRVEIEYHASRFEIIDNLGFSTLGLPPAQDTQPPVLQILEPQDGIVCDSFEGHNCFHLDGTVTENDKLKKVEITISSDSNSVSFNLSFSGSAPNFTFGHNAYIYGLFEGQNNVTIRAEDFAGLSDQKTIQVFYYPIKQQCRLLIITPREFRSALTPLAIYKNNTGMSAGIISVESIDEDPRFSMIGNDIQEKIKFAISYGVKNYDTEYAMLVGDVDRFPVRYCTYLNRNVLGGISFYQPSDLYFADLYKADGSFDNWDFNGNGEIGEIDGVWDSGDAYSDINVDKVNLRPDVAVGRVPASSIQEVSTYVHKIITYENGATPDWFKKILLLTGNPPYSDDVSTNDWISNNGLSGFSKIKYYHSQNTGTTNDRAAHINSYLNQGVGFVSFIGHGGVSLLDHIYDVFIHDNGLANSNRLPVIFSAACDTAHFRVHGYKYQDINGNEPTTPSGLWEFPLPVPKPIQPYYLDWESCAEEFLVKNQTGGIGYIGCYTGSQYGGVLLAKYFYNSYDQLTAPVTLGKMWNYAINSYINQNCHYDVYGFNWTWTPSAMFHHIQKYLLFGDPSLRLGGSPIKYYFAYQSLTNIITDLSFPSFTPLTDIHISGHVNAEGSILHLYEYKGKDMELLGTATNQTGDFTISPDGELDEGAHQLILMCFDAFGKEIDRQTILLTVDTTPPEITKLDYPKETTIQELYIRGLTEPKAEVRLYEGDILLASTGALVTPEGAIFEFLDLGKENTLPFGEHRFTLTVIDLAGNRFNYPELLVVNILVPPECIQDYPNPIVDYTGKEEVSAGGKTFFRYNLSVVNRSDYPPSLFALSPELPPCGLNHNASRTWVEIYDCNGNRLHGFCGFSSPDNLRALNFSVSQDESQPECVIVKFFDRLCQKTYTSAPEFLILEDIDNDGFTEMEGDCDDQDPDVYPGATEICNNLDDDCDGLWDEEDAAGCTTFYKDADHDGYGIDDDSKCLCDPDVTERYTATQGGDTNDLDPNIPGIATVETCMFKATIKATGQEIGDAVKVDIVKIGIDNVADTIMKPPPVPDYTVYMQLSGGLFYDYRKAGTGYEEWKLILRAGDEAVFDLPGFFPVLSWDPNEFCLLDPNSGSLKLYSEDVNGNRILLVEDMYKTMQYQTNINEARCLRIPNTCDFNYIIVWSMEKEITFDMNLTQGWSMISLPVLPDSTSDQNLFPEAVIVYGYDMDTGYKRVNELELGRGYWILMNEEHTYTLTGQPICEYTHTVNKNRWDMIGGCTYPAQASVENGDIGIIYGFLRGTGYQRLLESEKLEPGKGYWILYRNITGQAQLHVETTGNTCNQYDPIILANGSNPNEWDMDPYSIEDANIEGDILQVRVRYGGGCREHEFQLVAYSYFMESDPVQADILLSHNSNNDPCFALLTETLTFDLSPLKDEYLRMYPGDPDGTIILWLHYSNIPTQFIMIEYDL